jgi:cell division protease FtsH
MFLTEYQAQLQYCLAQAAVLLGGPAQPLWIEWAIEVSIKRLLKLEVRRGLGREPPVLELDRSKRGHWLVAGMELHRWDTPEGSVRVVKVAVPCGVPGLEDLWAVRSSDYRRFYRFLRRRLRAGAEQGPPVMPDHQRQQLWENTVGFLRRGAAEMARYGVTPRRGVLLLGEPGNGKTMACRWLAAEARRCGLEWRSISPEMYEDARAERQVPALFRLPSPGIVLFDDFDTALLDRRENQQDQKLFTFLAELDGLEQKTGIVYLFASNAALGDLDPAMCRPGRIDVVVQFPRPSAGLRRQLISRHWHRDLLTGTDVQTVVRQTDGLSFAEIEELRKLLVIHHLETGRWDWPRARAALRQRNQDQRASAPIGFGRGANGKDDHAAEPALR